MGKVIYNFNKEQIVDLYINQNLKLSEISENTINMISDIIKNTLNIQLNKYSKVSSVGNIYYDLSISEREKVLNILNWIYETDYLKYCLIRKFKYYLIFKELINTTNKVNDIVESLLKDKSN